MERKSRTLQATLRTLLQESKFPKKFWAEAVSTSCYVLNRVLIRPIILKIPYELLNNKIPNRSYFKIFGSKCFILNTSDIFGKFDAKSYEGIFIGYSQNSKAYHIFNIRKSCVEEYVHITFNETNNDFPKESEDDVGNLETVRVSANRNE